MTLSWIMGIGYLVLAPFLGALLEGCDRKISARMQGRQGPPLLQPLYDVRKLFSKQDVSVNSLQKFLVCGFLVFAAFTGALYYWGGDILLVFFALTLAGIFYVLSAASANSPFSSMSAQRELAQMMSYEPMVLLTAIGFYIATGSFSAREIAFGDFPPILYLPGFFLGFVFIITIKMHKSPFDISSSHHAHQEMVSGMTTDLSGNILGLVSIANWYEEVFLLGIIGLFFACDRWFAVPIAVLVALLCCFLETFIDNVSPRVKWQDMLKTTWGFTMISGGINLIALMLLK